MFVLYLHILVHNFKATSSYDYVASSTRNGKRRSVHVLLDSNWWWDSARLGTVGAAKQGKSYLSNRSALESLSCLASVAPV